MEKAKLKVWVMFCFLCVGMLLNAQNVAITLKNPSFEDVPRHNRVPKGWTDCGFRGETAPDIHPSGAFEVTTLAKEGSSYLGLVVRENYTWERVSQQLSSSMQRGSCYAFSIYLAKSPAYQSYEPNAHKQVNYTCNVKLRIFGGFSPCHQDQLLAESPLISNHNWEQFHFHFKPKKNYTHLTLEAFYQTPEVLLSSGKIPVPNAFPYNGNILLDHASELIRVSCENQAPIVKASSSNKPRVQTNRGGTIKGTSKDNQTTIPYFVPPDEQADHTSFPVEIGHFPDTLKTIHEGQTLRLQSIIFEVNDSTLHHSSFVELDKLSNFLAQNPHVVIEIGGHTNGICETPYCNALSLRRARAVATYLIEHGTAANRLQVKGYGKTQPLSASKGDPLNQRVEVKILAFK